MRNDESIEAVVGSIVDEPNLSIATTGAISDVNLENIA